MLFYSICIGYKFLKCYVILIYFCVFMCLCIYVVIEGWIGWGYLEVGYRVVYNVIVLVMLILFLFVYGREIVV